jgi:hypothetical protein
MLARQVLYHFSHILALLLFNHTRILIKFAGHGGVHCNITAQETEQKDLSLRLAWTM